MIGFFKRKAREQMTAQIIGGLLRALLAATPGLVSNDEITQLASAGAVIVTAAWSAWQKYQANKVTQK